MNSIFIKIMVYCKIKHTVFSERLVFYFCCATCLLLAWRPPTLPFFVLFIYVLHSLLCCFIFNFIQLDFITRCIWTMSLSYIVSLVFCQHRNDHINVNSVCITPLFYSVVLCSAFFSVGSPLLSGIYFHQS